MNQPVRNLHPPAARRARGRSRTALLAGLSLALAALPSAVLAQGDAISGLRRIGDYVLEVEGEPVPAARIYAASDPPAILIMTSKFVAPVLLKPRTGAVESISLMKIAESEGGTLDLLPGAAVESHEPFSVDGVKVRFEVGGTSALIMPKPPLTGLQGVDGLKSYSPEYARLAESYRPSDPIVANLRSQGKEVRVRVFFGTWCPFCGQMVPRVMRVAEELAGSNVRVEFYGLPREFSDDAEASRYDIRSVPTGVVFVDGAEVGRISGNRWKIPELALNNLVAGR